MEAALACVPHLLEGKGFGADAPLRQHGPTVDHSGLELLQMLFF